MNKEEAMQVLDGLMLGDGGIMRYRSTAIYDMQQSKHTISTEDHLKWLYWLRDNVFTVLNIKAVVRVHWGTYSEGARKGQKHLIVQLRTEQSTLLAQVYDEWYIGGEWVAAKGREKSPSAYYLHGKTKVIPKRLMDVSVLPILTLVHWFLGDGGSSWCHPERLTPQVQSSFSTYCFTEKEVYHLISMLNNKGIRTIESNRHPHKSGSGLAIRLSENTSDYFMSLVEPHIMEIFGNSIGSSYKSIIKYKKIGPAKSFNNLRYRIGGNI